MDINLQKLNDAVAVIVKHDWWLSMIEQLKKENDESQGPFVWAAIDLRPIDAELPENIKSGWIFVLKKDVPSGCHYHPNSIQHMVMIEGEGQSTVGNISRRMREFGSHGHSLDETWYVIPEGVPHEFFPEERDMVVISFHTCEGEELIEIECDTGAERLYEG